MNRRQPLVLPVLGGVIAFALGIAALQSGERSRASESERLALVEAHHLASEVQAKLNTLAAFLDESPAEAATDNMIYWFFDGNTLSARPQRFASDKNLLQQLRNADAPALLAPVTSENGQDFVVLTVPHGDAWRGVAMPADALLVQPGSDALAAASLQLSWAGEERDTGIFQAGMGSALRDNEIDFAVPNGTWRLAYDTNVIAARQELYWALLTVVALLSYTVAIVLHRLSLRPRGLQGDLSRLNERFNNINAELGELLVKREHARDRLFQTAITDSDTGLPNRQAFVQRLEEALTAMRGEPGSAPLVVAAVGLRELEIAEHTLGRPVIATIVAEVAARLRAALGEDCQVARVNSFQLGVTFECDGSEAALQQVTERLADTLPGVYRHARGKLNMSPHIGIAIANDGYRYAGRLLEDAMSALTDAESSPAMWSMFTAESRDERATMIQLESDIRAAIENNEFRLFYQPIVHTASGALRGFECLVRWQHPVEGLLGPDKFIGLCESTGLITDLTRWAFHEAVRQASAWNDLRSIDGYLSVNLSTLDLRHEGLAEELTSSVLDAGLSPSAFRLEITESMIIDNVSQSRNVLKELRAAGFGIMMDDFGTGFSSLSYLRQLPFSAVKIDRSFTQAIASDSKDYGMMRNILNLVHFLEMESIIEGIETSEQYDLLVPLEPVYLQGYLFSKPMPAIDAEEYLAEATLKLPAAATSRR